MTEITEERAKQALDFIARKLGYEAMAISVSWLLYVFRFGHKQILLRATGIGELVIIAHNFKEALMKVLGTTCMTSEPSCHPFTVPGSLEELLMQMDMES